MGQRFHAAQERSTRQEQVHDWIMRNWGKGAMDVQERFERLYEEVCELGQALNVPPERLMTIRDGVYAKPKGKPSQEIGGIGVCLLGLCEVLNVQADRQEHFELERILNLSAEHFRQRHAAKVASGLALDLGLPV